MFYLETKDGERFFTSVMSNDKDEFEKIVASKMGDQAVELLNDFIEDAREEGEESVSFDDYVDAYEVRYLVDKLSRTIDQMKAALDSHEDADTTLVEDMRDLIKDLSDIQSDLDSL